MSYNHIIIINSIYIANMVDNVHNCFISIRTTCNYFDTLICNVIFFKISCVWEIHCAGVAIIISLNSLTKMNFSIVWIKIGLLSISKIVLVMARSPFSNQYLLLKYLHKSCCPPFCHYIISIYTLLTYART